jgi:ribose transport system substrate-binding protein
MSPDIEYLYKNHHNQIRGEEKMKKFLNVTLFLVMIAGLVLSACGQADQTPAAVPTTAAQPASQADDAIVTALKDLDPNRGEGKTIGVVAFFQANDWNRNALKAITDNLEQYGYTVNIIDGNGDAAKMNAAIDTHIANKVDGIIIAGGDGTALKTGSAHIVEAGIPYTVIDMFQEGAITNVMADNWGGGTQLGLYVVNQIEGKGKVLILDTPSWVTLLARADAADVVFNPHRTDDPKTGIVAERFDIDAGNAVTDA